MSTNLLKIALRQQAVFISNEQMVHRNKEMSETTSVLLANCKRLGFTFSEDLLVAINGLNPTAKLEILSVLQEVTGVKKNWTPLVKQWNIPTGESIVDHIITFFENAVNSKNGTKLQCGHLIPNNTFPLERYNGCPYCGTPFVFETLEYIPSVNKLKVLELWTEVEAQKHLTDLLNSPVALDATQVDSLKVLLSNFDLPVDVKVAMKETLMVLIDTLIEQEKADAAGKLFANPNDILRYLWYKHTGYLQIVQPTTIARRTRKNGRHINPMLNSQAKLKTEKSVNKLKLKFSRTECKRYAKWINDLSMEVAVQCEIMHPKREIWVRVIRALRLSEYGNKKGFENLAKLLDVFYRKDYKVWQGEVDEAKSKVDAEQTFKLLKQRPGLFARSLFATMLWFGPDETLKHFREIMFQIPARLIYTLNMYADLYFVKNGSRMVKPLGGLNKKIDNNGLLKLYTDDQLTEMKSMIQDLSLELIRANLKKEANDNTSIFIEEGLYNIPIAIGDRNENVQDLPSALMGTRFPVVGDTVRLFLQWGNGLPAQHLDMDLSCCVAYENTTAYCSYSQLTIQGCKHSGDIQQIPANVGTAEYIDIDVNKLLKKGAKYVTFTCNAYTNGSLSPNLVVGWMDSRYPMKISKNGVAYDPTAVQHQVTIGQTLTKGLVFGVLDVARKEIIWLEMSFGGQIVQNMSVKAVEALINRLESKLKIGDLLAMKAEVQALDILDSAEAADEVYDIKWARNTAAVSEMFLG